MRARVINGYLEPISSTVKKKLEKHEGKIYDVELEPYKGSKSPNQMRYFHGVVLNFLIEKLYDSGNGIYVTKETMKDAVKQRFLGKSIGKGLVGSRGVSSLEKNEFVRFLEAIDEWCLNAFGEPLPTPDYDRYEKTGEWV